jgi:hypothetical protein
MGAPPIEPHADRTDRVKRPRQLFDFGVYSMGEPRPARSRFCEQFT